MSGRHRVLTIHGVGALGRPMDDDEQATTITVAEMEQALDIISPRPWVRLTFDDGNATDLEVALPRLLDRGLRATFFVLAGKLGQPGWLDGDGVRELDRAGMTIGSHGWAHRSWRGMSEDEATRELVDAPQVLADLIGRPVTEVAVPFGSYDRQVLSRLRDVGTTKAHTSDGGPADERRWLLPRTSLHRGLRTDSVRALVDDAEPIPARATRTVKKLVKRCR